MALPMFGVALDRQDDEIPWRTALANGRTLTERPLPHPMLTNIRVVSVASKGLSSPFFQPRFAPHFPVHAPRRTQEMRQFSMALSEGGIGQSKFGFGVFLSFSFSLPLMS